MKTIILFFNYISIIQCHIKKFKINFYKIEYICNITKYLYIYKSIRTMKPQLNYQQTTSVNRIFCQIDEICQELLQLDLIKEGFEEWIMGQRRNLDTELKKCEETLYEIYQEIENPIYKTQEKMTENQKTM